MNTKTLAIALSLLLLFPAPIFAQNSPNSESCADLVKPCTQAARELKAARKLIAGYEEHIAAAEERIRIAERQIQTLREKGALEVLRASELETVIAAEREIKADLLKKIEPQKDRISSLEKQLGRARKWALVATVAAGVGIVIAIAGN